MSDAVEDVARALWVRDGYDLDADPGSSTDREMRPEFREQAEAAIATARPHVERETVAACVRVLREEAAERVRLAGLPERTPKRAEDLIDEAWHLFDAADLLERQFAADLQGGEGSQGRVTGVWGDQGPERDESDGPAAEDAGGDE